MFDHDTKTSGDPSSESPRPGLLNSLGGMGEGVFEEIREVLSLIGRLGGEIAEMGDQKLALLKVEIVDELRAYMRDMLFMAVASSFLAAGLVLCNMALGYLIAAALPFAPAVNFGLGFLIVAAVDIAVGVVIMKRGKNAASSHSLRPDGFVDDLRRDREWIRKELLGSGNDQHTKQ